MPLPPLPENNTPRLFLDYTTGRIEHTVIFRAAQGVEPFEARDAVYGFFLALQSQLVSTWAVTGLRWQEWGSIITLPTPLGDFADFSGTGLESIPVTAEPLQWNFVGRGQDTGRLVKVGLYGLDEAVPAEYRYVGSGLPLAFANALTALATTGNTAPVTIGGDAPLWKPYVNVQYNSYWERRARD